MLCIVFPEHRAVAAAGDGTAGLTGKALGKAKGHLGTAARQHRECALNNAHDVRGEDFTAAVARRRGRGGRGAALEGPAGDPAGHRGVVLALVPGLPRVELVPELVLLVVLPPLIYSAGVAMSWREFRFNLRPIALLAVGCVVVHDRGGGCRRALAARPAWPVAFVLGAIVSPPDVVAPLAIARRLELPRRLLVILEGEGLANDATALILYRFAVAAVSTGDVLAGRAAGTFALIVVGEIVYGILVGWLMLHLRRLVHDPRVEIMLSLVTPYLAYWVPEHCRRLRRARDGRRRTVHQLEGPAADSLGDAAAGHLLLGFADLHHRGLGLPAHRSAGAHLARPHRRFSSRELLFSALVTSVVVIVARFVWVFPATYLPRWLVPALAAADPSPPWQMPFVLAFTGVRGDRIARGGPGDSADDRERRSRSPTAT